MAIFVANRAFVDPGYAMVAKVAILAASLVAGAAGFAFLYFQAKIASAKGVTFEMEMPAPENMQSHAAHELVRKRKRERAREQDAERAQHAGAEQTPDEAENVHAYPFPRARATRTAGGRRIHHIQWGSRAGTLHVRHASVQHPGCTFFNTSDHVLSCEDR